MHPGSARFWTRIVAAGSSVFLFGIPLFFWLKRCSENWTDFQFLKLVYSPFVLHLVMQTMGVAVQSGGVIFIAGLAMAFLIYSFKPRLRMAIRFLLSVFWLLPSLFFVWLTRGLLKQAGLEQWLYRFSAVQVCWVIGFTPYFALGVLRILEDLDPREIEAAKTLGASASWIGRTLYWRAIRPGVGVLSIQIFWLIFTSFSVVVLLGGGSPQDTLETAIYQAVRFDEVRVDHAFALAIWQVVLLLGLTQIQKLGCSRVNQMQPIHGAVWGTLPVKRKGIFQGILIIISGLGVAMMAKIFLSEPAGGPLFQSWLQSCFLAAGVSGLTLILAFVFYFGLRRFSDWGAYCSPMILSLMVWEAYGAASFPILLCLVVQVALFLPWVSRNLYPLLDRKRIAEQEAARTLGATNLKAWLTVEWPRVLPEVKKIAVWISVFSMAEVSSVILFSRGQFEPLAVWSQNQFARFQWQEGYLGVEILVLTTLIGVAVSVYQESA